MKETGIIMSGDHPKLILERRKTQTRRTYGLEKINTTPDEWFGIPENIKDALWRFHNKDGTSLIVKCPYGQVGDRLWVKETWKYLPDETIENPDAPNPKLWYLADFNTKHNFCYPWKSPLFMPHWASRITLEITEIRVERVQEISPADCGEEGINRTGDIIISGKYMRETFSKLWNSLNAKRGYGWEPNPWVWVIGFKLA